MKCNLIACTNKRMSQSPYCLEHTKALVANLDEMFRQAEENKDKDNEIT